MIIEIPLLKKGQVLDDIHVDDNTLLGIADQFYYNKKQLPCVHNNKSIGKIMDLKIKNGILYSVCEIDNLSVAGKKIKSKIDVKYTLNEVEIYE